MPPTRDNHYVPKWYQKRFVEPGRETLAYSAAQFRGMMGAFGRRLANTPGYNGRDHFFGYEWVEDKGTYRYWLPETVREAVRLEVIGRK